MKNSLATFPNCLQCPKANIVNGEVIECECDHSSDTMQCQRVLDWKKALKQELQGMLIGFRGVYHESARPVQIVKGILGEVK